MSNRNSEQSKFLAVKIEHSRSSQKTCSYVAERCEFKYYAKLIMKTICVANILSCWSVRCMNGGNCSRNLQPKFTAEIYSRNLQPKFTANIRMFGSTPSKTANLLKNVTNYPHLEIWLDSALCVCNQGARVPRIISPCAIIIQGLDCCILCAS